MAAKKVVKKAPAKKSPAKKALAKKVPAKKATQVKKAPAKKAAPVKKAPAKKVPAKPIPAKKAPEPKPEKPAKPEPTPEPVAPAEPHIPVIDPTPMKKPKPVKKKPAVREDETPWTKAELNEVKKELIADVARLQEEIAMTEADLEDLVRDSGDGAGDDQADAGSKTFEREHEMSLANNAREMLLQAQHALERIENGSYGSCESCGNAVGKLRLQAFPRATLCLACKQLDERY